MLKIMIVVSLSAVILINSSFTQESSISPHFDKVTQKVDDILSQVETNHSFPQLDFSADLGFPMMRSGSFDDFDYKHLSKSFILSYYPIPFHGLTMGLAMENSGSGGELFPELSTLSSTKRAKLGALNFMLAYSYKSYFHSPQINYIYDIGPGIYRFTGIKDESQNNNIFVFNQKFALTHSLPSSIQFLDNIDSQVGVALMHTWIPQTQIKGQNIKGHNLTFTLQLRFNHFL